MCERRAQIPDDDLARGDSVSTAKTPTASILLVDSDQDRAAKLASALEARSAVVAWVQSGFTALTSIERARPACILTRAQLQDMSGQDLLGLLRRDFALGRLRMVLLVSSDDQGQSISTTSFEMVVDTDRGVPELVRRLRSAAFPGLEGLRTRPVRQDHGDVSGTLDVLNFTEVTQAFSQAKKTGKLSLWTDDGSLSTVYFLNGRILHASHGNLVGRAAFASSLDHADCSVGIRFRFAPLLESNLIKVPRTINLLASQLLLEIAVELDESGDSLPEEDDPGSWREGA